MGVMTERRSYVAGRWVEGDESLPVENPADETNVAELSVTPDAEFRRAIDEARRAFDEGPWPSMSGAERARLRARARSTTSRPTPTRSSPTMVAEAGQPTMFAEAVQLRSGAGVRPRHHRPLPLDGARGLQPGSRRPAGHRDGSR